MELHVKVLAVLYIAYGAFGLVLSLLMLFVFGDVTGLVDLAAVEEPEALLTVPIIGVIGTFIIRFILALSVPRVVAGFGLVRRRPWARLLAIVLSVLSLVNFPFGTALGAYGLWVLLSKATGPVFSLAPTATGGPLTSPTGAAAFVELVRLRAAGRTTPAPPDTSRSVLLVLRFFSWGLVATDVKAPRLPGRRRPWVPIPPGPA